MASALVPIDGGGRMNCKHELKELNYSEKNGNKIYPKENDGENERIMQLKYCTKCGQVFAMPYLPELEKFLNAFCKIFKG